MCCGRILSAPTVRWGSCCHSTNGSVPSGFGRILSAPTVWVGKLLPFSEQLSCVHFGRLRASPTGLRSFRFSLCTLPGGSGSQRIGTSSVRHCPAALPPVSTASKCFADYQLLCELLILRLEIRIFYGYNSVCVFVIGKLNHWKISRLSEKQSYGAARCGCQLQILR